jgi:hypothetical protein
VGAFKSLSGGKNSLEITDCDVEPHQLAVRIEKKGEQVVFQRVIMDGVFMQIILKEELMMV